MTYKSFVALFALAAVLRVFNIHQPPLWYDENFTLLLARLPFRDMLAATAGDVHPPLWYIIEWSIYHASPNAPAWVIRVPALIFSLASLPLFWRIMVTIGINPRVQFAAMSLMSVLPFQIYYAQDGRMYALLQFGVLLTLFAALRRKYILTLLGSILLLYTQNYGLLYLPAIALVTWIRERETVFNWTTSAMVTAGIFWFPWAKVIANQMDEIGGRYWIMDDSVGAVLTILYRLVWTDAMPQALMIAAYFVVFSALICGMIAFVRSSHPERATVAIMAFVPLLAAWVVSVVWHPILIFRPLIGISPFLYLIVCWSLDENPAN